MVTSEGAQIALSTDVDQKTLCSLEMHLSVQIEKKLTGKRETHSGGRNTVEFWVLRSFFHYGP